MKNILLSLFLGLIGLINFGYCEYVEDLITYIGDTSTISVNSYSFYKVLEIDNTGIGDTYCLEIINSNNTIVFGFNDSLSYDSNFSIRIPALSQKYACVTPYKNIIYLYNPFGSGPTAITYKLFKLNVLINTSIPVMTILECQTEYNLIPVSSVDQNYCVNNNLCPIQGDCPDIPGSGDLQYSNIYINNILHPGRQNIFINIPDYITWDYSQNEVDFNVYVGSGYDVDYINSIVDINSYRPTSEDFTNVFVSGLTLVFPYVFVALLILFIWKLLKRIFK